MDANERKLLAYRMRVDGMSYRAIGERLGVSSARARQLVCGGSPEWQAINRDIRRFREQGKRRHEFRDEIEIRKQQANDVCLQVREGGEE